MYPKSHLVLDSARMSWHFQQLMPFCPFEDGELHLGMKEVGTVAEVEWSLVVPQRIGACARLTKTARFSVR